MADYLGIDMVADNGLYFYDRETWELLKFVQVPWPGVNHLDFSADGSYLMVTTESAGAVVKIDTDATGDPRHGRRRRVAARHSPRAERRRLLRRQPGHARGRHHRRRGHRGHRLHPDLQRCPRLRLQPRRDPVVRDQPPREHHLGDRPRHPRRRRYLGSRRLARHGHRVAGRQPAVDLEPLPRHRHRLRPRDRRAAGQHRDRRQPARADLLAAARHISLGHNGNMR